MDSPLKSQMALHALLLNSRAEERLNLGVLDIKQENISSTEEASSILQLEYTLRRR